MEKDKEENLTMVKADAPPPMITKQPADPLTPDEVLKQVKLISEIMKRTMIKDVHYGVIPGCKKPSLLKSGAEKICLTFRLAPQIEITELSGSDYIRYRVLVRLLRSGDGQSVGEGIGECSSLEEKFHWKRTYSKSEWENKPESHRRIKYGQAYNNRSKTYEDKEEMQVIIEPANVGNTVLKMAKKRALVDATLTCTAASDLFEQDIEDMPAEIVQRNGEPLVGKPHIVPAKEKSSPAAEMPLSGNEYITPQQVKGIQNGLKAKNSSEEDFCQHFKVQSISLLPAAKLQPAYNWLALL